MKIKNIIKNIISRSYKLILIMFLFLNQSVAVNSLASASDSIFEGASILTKFFWAACIFTGVFLLVSAIASYREHRNNPKLIPLSTVIVYVILGLAVISIPFLNRLFGSDGYDIAQRNFFN